MALNRNMEKVISAALAVERVAKVRPWTALDLIEFLDQKEGERKPSDATVYRLLHRLDEQLGLVTSIVEESEEGRAPGRPRREYSLTVDGVQAADSAAGWLCRSGIAWAGLALAGNVR
ncbi:MAG: PadR family transcriptional regulator [Actinomycetota bacterium]